MANKHEEMLSFIKTVRETHAKHVWDVAGSLTGDPDNQQGNNWIMLMLESTTWLRILGVQLFMPFSL